MNTAKNLPIKQRAPITQALKALMEALNFWCWLYKGGGKDYDFDPDNHKEACDDFMEIFQIALYDQDIDGKKMIDEITAELASLGMMRVIIGYAAQAFKAEKSGEHEEAWRYASESLYWAGILKAEFCGRIYAENPAVAMAKMRHQETKALIDYAVKYWEENIDKNLSAQKAANELINVVPLSHKKLADAVSKAKKSSPMRKRETERKKEP